MKDWFPLTSYEFYAYVSAGTILIAAVDYSFAGAVLSSRTDWSAVQAVFWILAAYLTGQLCAAPSSAILEHWFSRTVFLNPVDVALSMKARRPREIWLARTFANREYGPLPPPIAEKILDKASKQLGKARAEVTGESVFELAFPVARSNADTAARLDQFLSLYGFSRNICFSSVIALICLSARAVQQADQLTFLLLTASIILCVGMYGRFIKFYSAYSREVLRSYWAA